eukprot:169717-Pelagomonas_calceolata.AAC.3
MKLAELVLVMVPGSVEDQRMFSALKYLTSPQRSSLKEKHTNVARCKKRSLDDMGYKEMLVKCYVLGGLASWRLDMPWVLGLSKHLEVHAC